MNAPGEQGGISALLAEENDASARSEDLVSKSYSILLPFLRLALDDRGEV